jgi:hypothetical protein
MAASDVYKIARNLFTYAHGNSKRIAQIRAAFDEAVAGGALSKGGLDVVTSATKNGVSVQKMVGLDEGSRQTALRIALQWLDAGYAPPTGRSLARF